MPVVEPRSRAEPGEELIDLLARLVAFPTESRSPNTELIALCAEQAKAVGAAVTELPGDDGRANLLVRFGPQAPGGVLLSGHTDVVPAGDGWSTDPYELAVVEGDVRGRGAADMKGFVAVALSVLALSASTRTPTLHRPVYLALSYDEEIGCVGVRKLLAELDSSVAPDLVVIGEPTGMQVCVAHSGKAAFGVELRGQPAHSCRAASHPSAVVAAADLVQAIDRVQRDGSAGPTGQRTTTNHRHISTNVGIINGGVALNVMAAQVHLDFEVRHSANVDVAALLDPIWAEVRRLDDRLATVSGGVEVSMLSEYPAMYTEPGCAVVEQLRGIVGDGPVGAIEFGCEGGLYADRLGVPVVVCGPGHITDAHRPDEYVTLDQLGWCRQAIEGLIGAFCKEARP